MSLSDPIGDMIARIKNAQIRNHKKVELPSSNFKAKIAEILKIEGFIIDYSINSETSKSVLKIDLKYHSGNPVISTIERISTPKGVMTDIDARKQKVGGEIICKVF